jgi:hypothetical protein
VIVPAGQRTVSIHGKGPADLRHIFSKTLISASFDAPPGTGVLVRVFPAMAPYRDDHRERIGLIWPRRPARIEVSRVVVPNPPR